jgi:hypothetical protein
MKQVNTGLLLLIILFSCKKQEVSKQDDYLQEVKTSLMDSLSSGDYAKLDFPHAVAGKVDSVGLFFIKIPFKEKKPEQDFVIAKTNAAGLLTSGKIVHLEGNLKKTKWEGSISISSLDRHIVLSSAVENGHITAFHPHANLRAAVVPDEDIMPEFIICYTISSSSAGIDWSAWMQVQSLFYGIPYDFGGNYYSNIGGGGGGSGTGGSNLGQDGLHYDHPIRIDEESFGDDPSIEVEKYVGCFDKIPDAGATCSIEIFTDIPVDSDPNKIFDINSGSPGHCFIQLKKSNGSEGVLQNLGFYPKSGFKVSLTNAPVDAKFVDDGGHEYNASLKMVFSPADLRSTLTEILYMKNMKYDVDNFNCTDWALNVFNKSRTNKLEIPLYDIPGNVPSSGTQMPQGLYNKLKQMKATGDPEAANITIDILKGWVASSTGPCN